MRKVLPDPEYMLMSNRIAKLKDLIKSFSISYHIQRASSCSGDEMELEKIIRAVFDYF
jgi:hypothetical protein